MASRRITSASSSPRPRAIPPSPQIHCTHRYTPITRATLAQVLGIDTGASRGFPLTEGESPRAHPIRFSSRYEAGVILEDGSLCSWTANGVQLRIYRGGSWRPLDAEEERICVAARSSSGPPLRARGLPPIPPKLADELRALGYVD